MEKNKLNIPVSDILTTMLKPVCYFFLSIGFYVFAVGMGWIPAFLKGVFQ